MFRPGYIVSPRGDLVWFLGLPFAALLFGLACQRWLTPIAVISVGVWITVPHQFATWLRTFGFREEWQRNRDRLFVGSIVLFLVVVVGILLAPITFLMLMTLWDYQHSLMQQHGFARIYDFKAKAGAPSTA